MARETRDAAGRACASEQVLDVDGGLRLAKESRTLEFLQIHRAVNSFVFLGILVAIFTFPRDKPPSWTLGLGPLTSEQTAGPPGSGRGPT